MYSHNGSQITQKNWSVPKCCKLTTVWIFITCGNLNILRYKLIFRWCRLFFKTVFWFKQVIKTNIVLTTSRIRLLMPRQYRGIVVTERCERKWKLGQGKKYDSHTPKWNTIGAFHQGWYSHGLSIPGEIPYPSIRKSFIHPLSIHKNHPLPPTVKWFLFHRKTFWLNNFNGHHFDIVNAFNDTLGSQISTILESPFAF